MVSTTQIVVILIIALLLFGGKKIPEIASSIGKGIKNLKKELSDKNE